MPGHLAAVYLKETFPGKFREIPFGTGHVDFKKVIHAAWKEGMRKYVTEFWYTGGKAWMQDLYFAKNMMSSLLEQECM